MGTGALTPIEKVWRRVDTSAGPTACWPFMGKRDERGYGRIKAEGRGTVSRIVLANVTGRPLLRWEYALHSCDNPPCCNPAHLRIGTHADNMRDRTIRRRNRVGELNPFAKLTEADVISIKTRLASGEPKSQIARDNGVCRSVVCRIANGVSWAHVSLTAPSPGSS